jgi:hypothetical protein
MKHQTALIAAGCILGLVAILHGLRLLLKFQVIIGSWHAPMWVSVVGFFVALGLALWMLASSREK